MSTQTTTHITVILDRSGSMQSIRDDTIGGFNGFLDQQRSEPGAATLTLVQFDSQDPYEVIHHFQPLAGIPALDQTRYVPRGSTPLLDALGRGIGDLEQQLVKMQPEMRPAKVVFAVVTDGQENASQEFSRAQIEKMIKERTEKDDWQFVFLSADLAAFHDADHVGFAPEQKMLFEKSARGSRIAWSSLSQETSAFRSGRKKKVGFDQSDPDQPPEPPKGNA